MARDRAWDVEDLEMAVAEAASLTEAIRLLGLRPAGGNYKSVKAWVDRLGIPTDHFNYDRPMPAREAKPLGEVLVESSSYSRGLLKRRLYDEGFKQRACELCSQGELWRGQQISLILDHVNGVANDNRLENLRIVCPNCAATLPTHCGRNREMLPGSGSCARCGSAFTPKSSRQRYCSRACGQRHDRGQPRPERRKAQRPPLDQLLAEVREFGFSATGRKYGVSDNAIRKWIVFAERERTGASSTVSGGSGP